MNLLHNYKLGVGPMSPEIIDLLLEYSHEYQYPIMIIASRNQVDYSTGYVTTTASLVNQIKAHPTYDPSRILICRDHCGPYFSDNDRNKPIDAAIEECMQTILHDINNDFDLIHIDVSKIAEKQFVYAEKLIDYALSLNPTLRLEFGSEDNISENIKESIFRLDQQLEFMSTYKDNVSFFVSQTGSLTKQTQVGSFEVDTVRQAVNKTHESGFLFKEHNADYLTKDQVKLRVSAKIDAINIAPQLGVAQTKIIQHLGMKYKTEHDAFSKYTLSTGFWERWVTPNVDDDMVKVAVSGHYCFNSESYKNLYRCITENNEPFVEELKNEIFSILDIYRIGYEDQNENL